MAPEPFLSEVLSDVIRNLNRQAADFALAGGWAYSALIEPRATTDVDLLILLDQPSPDKIAQLFAHVFDSIIPHPAPVSFKGVAIWRLVGVRNGKEVIVDLLLAESDLLKTALSRKRTVDFLDMALPIITVEDLILLKAVAGRLQDVVDIEKIKSRASELAVDWGYVQAWQQKLGLPTV